MMTYGAIQHQSSTSISSSPPAPPPPPSSSSLSSDSLRRLISCPQCPFHSNNRAIQDLMKQGVPYPCS
ncbi:hypothetical protein DERF_011756 [Dermatophagoides farinae]|uniref:Uncharacterized protein n=1 Tax=Dermatophagoides farinae TaxID=6954 RepID=A0A922L1Y2_DERFA|nr:hypothetical protein DERF_011756 [Dermatophagoides farinae]